ncbi:MAG: 3-deoxy-manno-octulosonate cytidylyltransferase [Crocinitomicaceae bacterium]|nr:3-deoxy-manno-octulosonate cytidylyltransferase [Crocinitomicaceae bacterium]MDG1657663.1 3-deoxy-manno-octulosonate cytidylyltransferase [Crocinitomicaceae bacterium]MDG2440759.1 3-deoxy-manno-octulosonate cytidylyltransferase [Crocinitomicaceae bacterium]|tara:strand:+ start:6059 stop:6787 length:729 start_codon:yes stop_codon:yes gene_type:complete
MRIVGIIPARYESSRFPGKPLIDLKGKTMIQRVYEGAKNSTLLADVIVATDDQRIFNEVKRFGGNVMMTSLDHRTGTDRCGEIAQQVEADVIINIQGDEPLIDIRQIDALSVAFNDPNVEIATLGIKDVSDEDKRNPNRIKIALDHLNNALYFSRSPIPNEHHSDTMVAKSFTFYRHIGVYAYRKTALNKLVMLEPTELEKIESLEQLRWMYYGHKIRVVETTIETPNVDVPEDVENVLALL